MAEYESFQNHEFFIAICTDFWDSGNMPWDEEHRLWIWNDSILPVACE